MESVPDFIVELLAKAMREEICADFNLSMSTPEYTVLEERCVRAAGRFLTEVVASQEFDRYMKSQQAAMRETIARLQREVDAAQGADGSCSIRVWQERVHKLAVSKGWHDVPLPQSDPKANAEKVIAQLALIVTEVAEAIECLRDGTHNSIGKAGIPNLEEEIADVVIRSMDLASVLGFDLQSSIRAKYLFNQERQFRHGNKTL